MYSVPGNFLSINLIFPLSLFCSRTIRRSTREHRTIDPLTDAMQITQRQPHTPISSRTRCKENTPKQIRPAQNTTKEPPSISKRTRSSVQQTTQTASRPDEEEDVCVLGLVSSSEDFKNDAKIFRKPQPSRTPAKKRRTIVLKPRSKRSHKKKNDSYQPTADVADGNSDFEDELSECNSESDVSECESELSVDVPLKTPRSRMATTPQSRVATKRKQTRKRPSPNSTPVSTKKQRIKATQKTPSVKATPRRHPITPCIPNRKGDGLKTKDHFEIAKERFV